MAGRDRCRQRCAASPRGGSRQADRDVWSGDIVAPSYPVPHSALPRRAQTRAPALLWAAALLLGCSPSPARPPNILLISIDTARADHFSAYGYERDTTPVLAALAREGALFESAFAPSATTAPSHASLFTSAYPLAHRVVKNGRVLAPHHETLAERLREGGYQTGGIVSSYVLSKRFGLDQGFATWDEDFSGADVIGHGRLWEGESVPGKFNGRADDTTRRAIALLDVFAEIESPFLLFVHYFDPHDPYEPPQEFKERFFPTGESPLDGIVARYDAELAFTDREIGRLLARLDRLALKDDTIVVVVGDHGEGLMTHGHLGHGVHLYDEAIRVPLIVRWPGHVPANRRLQDPVALVDVAPSLLEWVEAGADGTSAGGFGAGRSLANRLEGNGVVDQDHPIWLHRRPYDPKMVEKTWVEGERFGIRRGGWKYIARASGLDGELYDLRADPSEAENVRRLHPDRAADLGRQLAAFTLRTAQPEVEARPLSQEDRRGLEALGYAQ